MSTAVLLPTAADPSNYTTTTIHLNNKIGYVIDTGKKAVLDGVRTRTWQPEIIVYIKTMPNHEKRMQLLYGIIIGNLDANIESDSSSITTYASQDLTDLIKLLCKMCRTEKGIVYPVAKTLLYILKDLVTCKQDNG